MLDLQFAEPLPPRELRNLRVLPLWLFPTNIPPKNLSEEEISFANGLPKPRSEQYKHSRSYLRHALSQLWGIPPLKIPLRSIPGKPPNLANGWGHVSISHCSDALLIGWSAENIGVDIERLDRQFPAHEIARRYYLKQENEHLAQFKGKSYDNEVLAKWITKEASIK